jgi:hypothetical protein
MDIWTAATQPFTFPLRVRRFLAEGTGLERVPDEMRRALATREERFLDILENRVYTQPLNPYRRLLEHAGCAFADVRDLTRRHGLEGALRSLAEAGVYLRAAELKGKEEVVRGQLRFRVNPDELRMITRGFQSQSSGSNNPPQRGTSSFEWMAQQTTTVGAFVLAHGLESHHHSAFEPMLPGQAGMMFMLMLARLGISCERWFARAVPFRNRLERAYFAVLAHELAAIGTRVGPGFGRPEEIWDDALGIIVQWIVDSHTRGRPTCVRTAASNAARIATRAAEMGSSLEGVTFLASGEPMTAAKRQAIERTGARTTVGYGFEPGTVWAGHGCANPIHGDEMHLSLNTLAVVNPLPLSQGDRTVHPLLYTTLYASAGRLLLNAENGDYATLDERNCGCRMHELGLTLHVHGVRSYEKLTAEGMSYPIDELIEILEGRLPAEFGGGPCDYQLLEEEGTAGQTHLTLRIHPRLGYLDEAQVLARFVEELSSAHGNRQFVTANWHKTGTFRVVREAPRTSLRGKMAPVHLGVGRNLDPGRIP